ncbi:GNAT family N-acetyltransferase [Sinomicrobium sp.]
MSERYEKEKIVLIPLSCKDSEAFYSIYNQSDFWKAGHSTVFEYNETPEMFTRRIMSLCDHIFTIRLIDKTDLIIGDCALHHWDKDINEIEIGGSLFNEHRGKGYMRCSFEILLSIAKNEMDVKSVVGKTSSNNKNAIRLAEKLGFKKVGADTKLVILKKYFEE